MVMRSLCAGLCAGRHTLDPLLEHIFDDELDACPVDEDAPDHALPRLAPPPSVKIDANGVIPILRSLNPKL
jgi:hypothetical protein